MDGFKGLNQKWLSEIVLQGFLDFQLASIAKEQTQGMKQTNFGELVNKKNSLLSELTERSWIRYKTI